MCVCVDVVKMQIRVLIMIGTVCVLLTRRLEKALGCSLPDVVRSMVMVCIRGKVSGWSLALNWLRSELGVYRCSSLHIKMEIE